MRTALRQLTRERESESFAPASDVTVLPACRSCQLGSPRSHGTQVLLTFPRGLKRSLRRMRGEDEKSGMMSQLETIKTARAAKLACARRFAETRS